MFESPMLTLIFVSAPFQIAVAVAVTIIVAGTERFSLNIKDSGDIDSNFVHGEKLFYFSFVG